MAHLLYLMVLADSHTISKSIDNDNKLDNNIFESIHDVDRPINPKTRKDRQHKYKPYYSKDEDIVLPDSLKENKPYTGLEKTTVKNQLLTLKATTEHAKHKSPRRRAGNFWRKLRGKDKKKDSHKHDSFDRNSRISNHKKEPHKDSTKPGPRVKGRRKNRKRFSQRQPEIKVTKRDANVLFSTRPYSYTPHQLQMGIAPQVGNTLQSKYRTKAVRPLAAKCGLKGAAEKNLYLQGQLASITSKISDLKEIYGINYPLQVNKPSNTGSLAASSAYNAETNKPRTTTTKETVTTLEPNLEGTAEIENMLNVKKARVMHRGSSQKPLVIDLISSSVTEATFNSYPVLTRFGILATDSSFSKFVSTNDNEHIESTTVASTNLDEFNINDSIFNANTENHYLVARSIKEETMTIAQNVEDILQRELKRIYYKVKHKVSSDLRKEIHTVKSTIKEGYHKISSKLSSKCKTPSATGSTAPSTSTCPPKPRTSAKTSKLKNKQQKQQSSTNVTTTAPRVKKKDDTEDDKFRADTYTPETVYKHTYDDYMMLTLFEQMLSKTHEDNVRKMLAITEFPVFPKIKRETFRLSKRNPETLTDVKLREVIQNLYDDGGNMPDYDYIDPSTNVSAPEITTPNNNYNDDYMLDSTDNSADGSMVEINAKNKEITPSPTVTVHASHHVCHANHVFNAGHAGHAGHAHAAAEDDFTAADTDISAVDSDNTALDTSYEGLSSKISYNEFVNGYKHYLNFQKDLINQNFSNLIKYQAHRHHSVDDIGKYILNKIPPLPSCNKKKREQRFSDDSENNMDYQEITTKNDDSWFRKHFYLFIDNGPPKKYHTSETVELKSPSTEPKRMTTEPILGAVPQDQIFIRIGSDGVPRKAKHTEEISLDDLSKVLDSIKDKQTSDKLSKDKPYTQKDIFNPIDKHNATDDASCRGKSIISKLFAAKRRHAPKKYTETTENFPDYMFTVSRWGRLRRSITKENLENSIMPDFINKDVEEKASTGSKGVLTKAVKFNNRETNKYGYVDIDLVPRQTAIVKLRDNGKKSRFKNFFKKFNFKKKKTINTKPKRSYPENHRRERFNPIKKLKSMFRNKEGKDKDKDELPPDLPERLLMPDYEMINSHLNKFKSIKFSKPLSIQEMQKQIPNISDIYFEPEPKKVTTKLTPSYYHLDDKDEDLLYNYHPSSSNSKPNPSVTTQKKPAQQMIKSTVRTKPTQAPSPRPTSPASPASSAPSPPTALVRIVMPSITKNPEKQVPPSNVMTVNLKTLHPPTTTVTTKEPPSLLTIENMSFILDNMQNKLNKNADQFPKVSTVYYRPSYVRQTGKLACKKNVQSSTLKSPLEELLIRSKLTRIAKFPIKKRVNKKRRHDDPGRLDLSKEYFGLDRPASVLEYIQDLGSTYPERRKSVKGNTLKKLHHSHVAKANNKDKSRYTDYFNDLLMWHNDILNLDTVPNPSWSNILKTHLDTGNIYTTPNMNNLLIGLKEINDYLDPVDLVTKSALITSPNKSLNVGSQDRVGVRHVKNHPNDQGIIRSVAMADNTIVTTKDMIIRGEAKYYQYNKPKKVGKKLSSSDFVMALDKLHVNYDNEKKEKVKRKGGRRFSPSASNNSEPSILVDTTLMAYDDDVDSVTKTLEIKKQCRNSQINFKATPNNKFDHSTLLKTNQPPMQYYTTPLPMKSHDFIKFLKEHQMDVEYVTSPILELPTIKTNAPTLKKNKELKPYSIPKITVTATSTTEPTVAHNQNMQAAPDIESYQGVTEDTTSKIIKSTTKKIKAFSDQIESKMEKWTKAIGKSVKFTKNPPKGKPKPVNITATYIKNLQKKYKVPEWEDKFDRYKRYRQLKLPTTTPLAKRNKPTQDVNYYSIFKRKMKQKLFEKKATELSDDLLPDHPTTESLTVDTTNKEIEITIINFDDIEKLTTHLPFVTEVFPTLTREEIDTLTNFGATSTPDTTVLSTEPAQKEKEMHNELLYKDILKERTTSSTTATTNCSTTDLIQTTEYADPIVNGAETLISTSTKPVTIKFPFEKIYPSILRKLPHGKDFNSVPKRVHISSHHYKYDVFYDDLKKTGKTSAEWPRFESPRFRPKHSTVTRPKGMRPAKRTHTRSSTIFSKGTESEDVKSIDKTSKKNRQKRRIWWREAPHKNRKHYKFREHKTKLEEGLTESTECFKTPIILTTLDIALDVAGKRDEKPFPSVVIDNDLVSRKPHEESFSSIFESEKPHEKSFTSAVDETTDVSWHTEPISDIEDVATMLDREDMGVTLSYIEDAVTLSAMRSSFITSATLRENARRALLRSSTVVAPVNYTPIKTPKPPIKSVTKPATKPATKHTTKPGTNPATTLVLTSQPGSLAYNLKQLQRNATSNKPTKDKEKLSSCLEKDRKRRLFKISALLQNRFKSLMNSNFTAGTKRTNATANTNATTQSSKSKPKRTCVSFPGSPNPFNLILEQPAAQTVIMALESANVREGFRVSCKPAGSSQHELSYQDESEDVTKASFLPNKCKSNHKICDCDLYVEPDTYNDQQYYEMGPMKCKCPNTTQPPCIEAESVSHCDIKREAQLNTFTAKDVAALEVIVDLMKNTFDEDNSLPVVVGQNSMVLKPGATKSIRSKSSTNSIQVHIAIPFDYQNGKKRSPYDPGPVRVRKVFSAKMLTPVDLEYQVHSFEGTMVPTITKPSNSINSSNDANDGLTPGMYLLIDKPKDGFALKRILGQITMSDLKVRHLAAGTTVSMAELKSTDNREETTSLKNLAKVTLSKEFVAVMNQKLIEMYENITRVDKDVNNNKKRPARSVWKSRQLKEKKEGRKTHAEKYIVKRRIDWERVKQFFGHDRVCNCKCKSNKTMCRACAASDAVIDELIFEFDNIGRYMADHCTEIQTFFWMNPQGGQRLRESVNKIEKSLSDYYKRVRGKCQGRLCKTFSTCSIDNRQFTKIAKRKKEDNMSRLVSDLAVLAEDLNKTISLKVCYNDKLKENGDKFLHLMNHCIMTKPLNKRSNPSKLNTPKSLIKNVYSLDNINVNIICKPESSTIIDEHNILSETISSQENTRLSDHLLDFDLEETKQKKHRGFKKLFPRKDKKSKLLSYFEFNKGSKTNYKRQVDNQVATPLISDGGGAFWYDYLKSGTNEPRLARDSIKDTPHIKIAVVPKEGTTGADVTTITSNNDLAINTKDMTVRTTLERNQRNIETTTDTLSQNINQMLQLFGSLQDIEAMNKNSIQTTVLTTVTVMSKGQSQDKPKKSLTIVGKVKQKMDKAWSKDNTDSIPESSTTKITSTPKNVTNDDFLIISPVLSGNVKPLEMTPDKSSATPYSKLSTIIVPKSDNKSKSKPIFGNEATTKLGFIKKLKAATLLIFRKEQTPQTPKHATEPPTQATTALSTELPSSTSGIKKIVSDVNRKVVNDLIESEITTQNPTILIINDYGNDVSSGTLNDKEEYRNLLLSIIQFETNNLNDEWDRVAYRGAKHRDDTDVKRSIVPAAKVETVKPPLKLTTKTKPPAEAYVTTSDQDKSTKEPEGLLNKIVSKMGIKVVSNKKKVVKKARIREVKKERKKGNFIKNRKMRINSYRQGNPTSLGSATEACHTRRPTKPSQICDIQATYDHVEKLQKTLPAKVFETLVRNITCYEYKNIDPIFTIPHIKKGKRWDWIRKKRSLKLHLYKRIKDEHNFDDDAFVVNFDDDSTDSFERFVKGDDGIYKIVMRKKRTANLEDLERGLRNIPTLMPGEDEVFVMAGDSVTLDCGLHTPVRTCDGKFVWKTDRKRMLKQDNVYVDGVSVTIHNVEPRNVGTYTCSLDHTVRRNLRLNVLAVPSFDVVFLPVYKTAENCSYDDLIAIQRLGSLMANETRCGKACSIRIDEPVCQRDKGTNSTLIRATAVISMTPRELNCSLQCKRDIVSSLVMLCAANTAILSSIKVLVLKDGVNETLTPWRDIVRPVVTHTLRKKDTNGHSEYHTLVPLLSPGKVDVVLICPAGFYLRPRYKLCSSCPPNTSSRAGDNTCRSCPRGTRAEPGAPQCHAVKPHPRRYDWWWYPPCGYVVACCCVLFGCTACVLLSVIVHVVSRDADHRENVDGDDEEQTILSSLPRVSLAHAHAARARPLSPSRVILPRFFRPSVTSSGATGATDSQETKFELWKERNRPPPLPPIDFDH